MSGKERMLITGGNPLEGEVHVSGGKNTAVALIPASLCAMSPALLKIFRISRMSMRWRIFCGSWGRR